MQFIIYYLNFQNGVLLFVMAYARIAIVFYMLPVLGERVLSGLVIKNTLITLTIIGLWPCSQLVISPEQGWFILLVQEVVVGLILAMTLCVPFWIAINIGELLDNQRGATLSDSIDPVNGGQSSVLSGFMNFAFGAIFFASGGMQLLLELMMKSYQVFPQGSNVMKIHWQELSYLLMVIAKNSIILAAPVLMVMLVAELLLGVFARYCPQLNPFSLSLTIKSFIAFIVFLLYGFRAMTEKPWQIFSNLALQTFIS
ncbi:type III secretion system export apparatus subunit SctT [Citrobacter sp. JGM124]|uniref:type III secretion system export apparatus subunit SctT n=1 Tax=Citrobacter sp. JGM124 TaxID=2799789 RepID=UPI001BA57591|nr:type III secretion system export apparatus subunit SctT [Citrobacter sp. JGM124]MBS0846927.1 type III secretion system export apparatus subunit SctT [Citrobacter sp. JGM124]